MKTTLAIATLSLWVFFSCDDAPDNCGDGVIQVSEECDGENVGPLTCSSFGYPGGTLSCSKGCTLDKSGCDGALLNCGDGAIDPGEECDGENVGVMTCAILGYEAGGELGCADSCVYDVSQCVGVLPTCGNGVVDFGEDCDGGTGDRSCESLGFISGTVRCTNCKLDTSNCLNPPEGCGDGSIQNTEECDGANLGGVTCELLGLSPGELRCSSMCQFDTSACRENVEIIAANDVTCILSAGGRAWCWGDGSEGQTGNGVASINSVPTRVTMPSGVLFDSIFGKYRHICGMGNNGTLWCWGKNSQHEVASATAEAILAPTSVAYFDTNSMHSFGAGAEYNCAVTQNSLLVCWGSNLAGKLGTGDDVNLPQPTVVSQDNFSEFYAGFNHSCGKDMNGRLWCWGYGSDGQLGTGVPGHQMAPVMVVAPPGVSFTRVTLGVVFTCALDTTGGAWCWGDNTEGELGNDSSPTGSALPVAVALDPSVRGVQIESGRRHSCLLDESGQLWCWGLNENGQLGDGTTINSALPVPVNQGEILFTHVSCGYNHTCALDTLGKGWCWGLNDAGQLGTGTAMPSSHPVPVVDPL